MSVATPPFAARKIESTQVSEPSWEVAKLFPSQGNWSEGEYLALAMGTNRLVELSCGSIGVMEIVSEDRSRDLETKRAEYAQGRIPEYWIVDPKLQEIALLTLGGATYQVAATCHRGDQVASIVLPGFVVEASAVFEAD